MALGEKDCRRFGVGSDDRANPLRWPGREGALAPLGGELDRLLWPTKAASRLRTPLATKEATASPANTRAQMVLPEVSSQATGIAAPRYQ